MTRVSITVAQVAKAKKHLANYIRYQGEVMTYAEMIHCCMRKGMVPDTCTEPRIKDMSRMAINRATIGEQYDHTKRQREAGNKTVYMMHRESDSLYVDISKTQYRYALAELFRDWANNFLTLEAFAEHYNTSVEKANTWIEEGQAIHNIFAATNTADVGY